MCRLGRRDARVARDLSAARSGTGRAVGRGSKMPAFHRRLLVVAALFVASLVARRAEAYPWMIRHGHDGCVQCHMDPSGAGLLTAYGRESGDDELTMRYRPTAADDDTRRSGVLWGHL